MSTPYPPAGLFRRLAAIIYDLFLVIGLWMLTTALLLPFTHGQAVPSGHAPFQLYLAAVAFAFFGIFWTRDGQTLGMKAWRVRVQQPDGQAISWRQALVRFVVAGLSAAALGLGFAWQVVDAHRRTWHDIASGTELVRLPARR